MLTRNCTGGIRLKFNSTLKNSNTHTSSRSSSSSNRVRTFSETAEHGLGAFPLGITGAFVSIAWSSSDHNKYPVSTAFNFKLDTNMSYLDLNPWKDSTKKNNFQWSCLPKQNILHSWLQYSNSNKTLSFLQTHNWEFLCGCEPGQDLSSLGGPGFKIGAQRRLLLVPPSPSQVLKNNVIYTLKRHIQ